MKTWQKRIGAGVLGLAIIVGVLAATEQPAMAATTSCLGGSRAVTSRVYTTGVLYWDVYAEKYAFSDWYIRRYVTGYPSGDPVVKQGSINGNQAAVEQSGSFTPGAGPYYMVIQCHGIAHTYGSIDW
jgi:hypothetical protein